jgi:antitoxin (DNA-binding transcriptional repressor) of toxin-antitoxin stability system/predicted nucleic acid-binding protein
MKKASISELKNQLSAYLQRVRAGQTVIVYDRDRPIARIDRVADEDDDDRIAQLQRAGIITPPSEPLSLDLVRTPLPRASHSEPGRDQLFAMLEADPVMVVWWGTPVELVSALSRRERDGSLPTTVANAAVERVRKLERTWQQVAPTDVLRQRAQRLLRVLALRAADSLQLAAALSISGTDPASVSFVTLDQRLLDAAQREGLGVAPL